MRFRYDGGNPDKINYFAGGSYEQASPSFDKPVWINGTALYGPGSYYFDIVENNNIGTPDNIDDIYVTFQQSEMRVRYVIKPN